MNEEAQKWIPKIVGIYMIYVYINRLIYRGIISTIIHYIIVTFVFAGIYKVIFHIPISWKQIAWLPALLIPKVNEWMQS